MYAQKAHNFFHTSSKTHLPEPVRAVGRTVYQQNCSIVDPVQYSGKLARPGTVGNVQFIPVHSDVAELRSVCEVFAPLTL